MRTHRNGTGKAVSMVRGVASGVLAGVAVLVAAAMGMAKLVDIEKIQWESIGIWIAVILAASSAVGAWIACHRVKHRLLMVCMLCGTCIWAVLLCMTALFFGGQYESVLVTGALLYGGCLAVFFLTLPRRKGSHRRNARLRHR